MSALSIQCPHCVVRPVNSIARVPFARGFVLAHQVGAKRQIGCVACVRRTVRHEAIKQLAFGWFSPGALILTVLFAPYNLLHSLFIGERVKEASLALTELGIQHETL